MKKIYYYLPLALGILASSCSTKDIKTAGIDKLDLDTTVVAGDDFYRFATGGWTDRNPIPDEYSSYGTFRVLHETNQKQLREIIEGLGKTANAKGTVEQKIGDLYKIGMDSVKLNTDRARPIKSQLDTINAATTVNDIVRLTGKIAHYASSPFFDFAVGSDMKNSSMNIGGLSQGGLGLYEREYYLGTDDESKKLLRGYRTMIERQFLNAGYTEAECKKAADAVLRIETALAKSHFEKEKTRIPELNYNKIKVSDLNKSVAPFEWAILFEALGVKGIQEVDVSQVAPIAAAAKLIQSTPINDSKAYLSWCVINTASGYMSDNFINTRFTFYGMQMNGAKVDQPRWKRVIGTVNNSFGEEVGQIYVKKYFPAEAKKRMLELVDNLKIALGERIDKLEWMGPETKAKAHEKLGSFIVKIGYPDKWRDASELQVRDDSYWANIMRVREFNHNFNINKLGKPVDKAEWFMSPQTINAYYNPTTNEICFPAAILQPPFFNLEADDAVNYGAIGVVIGHEMSHGFDDQGRKFDKVGNMFDWWTAADATKFDERTKVLVDHFNNITVLDSLKANGVFTLGENIGDLGGLEISYTAFLKTPEGKTTDKIIGFTPQQRFFLSYARIWAENNRDEYIKVLTKTDPHSLGKWRVNGTLPHMDAWYEAFNVTDKNALYIPKEKRASIW